MKMRPLMFCASCLAVGLLVSCAQLSSPDLAFKKSIKALSPNSKDRDDLDEVDKDWVSEAGVEARGDRAVEIDNDPFRKYLMSPKAQSIERNLGIQ